MGWWAHPSPFLFLAAGARLVPNDDRDPNRGPDTRDDKRRHPMRHHPGGFTLWA